MKKNSLLRLLPVLLLIAAWLLPVRLTAQDCNSGFYQMKEGSSFTTTTFDPKDKPLAKSVHTYRKINQTGSGFSAQMDQEVFDSKGESINKGSYEMSCQEGVVKLNVQDLMGPGLNMQNAGIKMEISGDALELPVNLSVGQTLKEATFNIKGSMGEMKVMDRDFKIKERKVEAQETLDTPAGKFDCYKVSYLTETTGMMGKARTLKTITWYAKGPGLVRNESYDEKGKLTGYSLLTAYTR